MRRKLVSVVTLTLLLVGMFTVAFSIQAVKADGGTIYIRADGSIDPPTAPISTVDNVTYTFTGDIINDSIVIERDNIAVDGAGYTVQGIGVPESRGLFLNGSSNVAVGNVTINSFGYGIWIYFSSSSSISGNNITNNEIGIYLDSSSGSSISRNNITNNSLSFLLTFSSNNIISGNSITNGILLDYSSNNSIFENNITTSKSYDLSFDHSSNNRIFGNNITNSGSGMYLNSSNSTSIFGNNILNNGFGISLVYCFNNIIFHNSFINNTIQASSYESADVWDDGYPSGGNYWSDYNGTDANHDGIGDIPYIIDANNIDRYPLMQPWVRYEGGTIYIRVDGSIYPPIAPIFSSDNISYSLTGNIIVDADGIVIERDNIVLNGAGYTVMGSGSGNGTTLIGRSNVTVSNLTIENFGHGIWVGSSSGSVLSGNNITGNNDFGVVFMFSPNSALSDSYVTDNNAGIYLGYSSNSNLSGNNVIANKDVGISFESSSNCILLGNMVTSNSGGVEFDYSSNNTLSGNYVAMDFYGIMLVSSSDNTLSGNNVMANSLFGIVLDGSSNNTLSGNVMRSNLWNFVVIGNVLSDYLESVDTSNLVDGKPVYYFVNQSELVVNADAYPEVGYLGFVNCANVTVQGLNLTGNSQGLMLAFTNDSRITGNNAANNLNGIELDFCSGNVLSGNNVTDNWVGIELYSASHNTLSGNNVTANSAIGIAVDSSSSDNRIVHNNFVGNSRQVVSNNLGDIWDDGYPSGGNYWSDYNGTDFYKGPYQDETGSDGIGDTPYIIATSNTDKYPLMKPYRTISLPGDINLDGTVDISDAIMAARAFGSKPGDPNWNSLADLKNDGIIDIFDVIILAGNFGKTV